MSSNDVSILSCSEGLSAVMDTSMPMEPAFDPQNEDPNELKEAGSQCSSASMPDVTSDTSPDQRMSLSSDSVILGRGVAATERKGKAKLRLSKSIVKRGKAKIPDASYSAGEEEDTEFKRALIFDSDKEDFGADETTEFAIRKKSFILSLMDSCSTRGYITCKLCRKEVWGPNGKCFILFCP